MADNSIASESAQCERKAHSKRLANLEDALTDLTNSIALTQATLEALEAILDFTVPTGLRADSNLAHFASRATGLQSIKLEIDRRTEKRLHDAIDDCILTNAGNKLRTLQ